MTPATLGQLDSIKQIKAHKNSLVSASKAIDSTLDDVFDIMTGMQSGLQTTTDGLNKLNEVRQSVGDTGNDTINNLNQTKDSLNTLQSRLNSFNYIISVSPYSTTASAMGIDSGLSETSNLLGNLSGTLGGITGLFDNGNGDKLNDGVKLSLNGASTLMSDMNSVLNKTDDLKKNKKIISNVVKDEWNRFDKDLGILDIDTSAKKVSFTSSKNTAPHSLQVVLRTQEIKVDKKAKLAAIEEEKDNRSFFDRLKLVFTTMTKTIKDTF